MQCPVCKGRHLAQGTLEGGLPAGMCPSCNGVWLARSDYEKWIGGGTAPETGGDKIAKIDCGDIPKAKICPACGHILLRHHVGHGASFYIDHCASCEGIWLDKNEWPSLKSLGLHDHLYKIMTASWQRAIREESLIDRVEESYRQRLGKDAYEKICDFATWMKENPDGNLAISYLLMCLKAGK